MDFTQYVNTNIGTIGHLLQATAPNTQSPHGAAVIAPISRAGMKDRYLSDKIFGFSAGCASVMPTIDSCADYMHNASVYDHDFETARPDLYQVLLEDTDIQEAHTAFANTGMFRFIYPSSQAAWVVLTVRHCTFCQTENGVLCVTGDLFNAFNSHITAAFDIHDAKEILYRDITVPNGHNPLEQEEAKAIVLRYDSTCVTLPFALSAIGADSAKASLAACSMDFDAMHAACKQAWNDVLGRVRVQGGTEDMKKVFYTALYRVMSRMHNYSVNGQYLGFDGNVHADGGKAYYCDDGIWDTYRGAHPLQLLLEPDVHRDIIHSYLRQYEDSGWLPRFPNLSGNAPCMIGHHTVSILAESFVKGVEMDVSLAYQAAHKNATERTMLPWRDGEAEDLTRCYYEKGFFPSLEEDEEETCDQVHPFENRQAVAVTIEHSYDDWCMAQLARAVGNQEEEQVFLRRSENYKTLYDEAIGFFHPRKMDGSFTQVYDPKWCGGQGGRKYYAENNAYIYNFAAQHDVQGMVALHGGKKAFAEKLDNLYVEQYDGVLKSTFLMQYPDATGLMGQFCMGNEPSFHIPYLYNFCDQAYKTQRKVRELIDLWFTNSPLGICGDEDGGAMSAFLAFSAMGFYPVNPASGAYDIGSPCFDKVEIDLPNGKTFTICAQGAASGSKYIHSAAINGQTLEAPAFTHEQMMQGGELTLVMGKRPNKTLWA